MSGDMRQLSEAEMVGGATQITSRIAMAVNNIILAWNRFRFGHHEASIVTAGLVSEVLSQAGAREVRLARIGAANLIERLRPVAVVEDPGEMMKHLLLMRRMSLFVDDADTKNGQMQQVVDKILNGQAAYRGLVVQVLIELGHEGMRFSHEAGEVQVEHAAAAMKSAAVEIIDRILLNVDRKPKAVD